MHKPIVIVGSSGNIGAATIKALQAYPKLCVRIGVRDAAKFTSLPPNFQVVHADMSNLASLDIALKDAETVFVIPPSTEDRGALAINAINAAKNAHAKHIVLISIATAEVKIDHIFARQFMPMEYALKSTGIHYTIIRLSMFIDNIWGSAESIKSQGVFYGPMSLELPYVPVVVSDVGEAVAKILSHPSHYKNKIYRFTVPHAVSHNDLATFFSHTLEKPVKYVQVPYDTAKKAMIGKGYPEWQVDGVLELYKLIEAGVPEVVTPSPDLQHVLGHAGTSVDTWVHSVKLGFQ